MLYRFSLLSVLFLTFTISQGVIARDVQQRPRGEEPTVSQFDDQATAGLSVEERLERLERILNNQGLVDMHLRLQTLQEEVQTLRGEQEVLAHQIQDLKQRQRELYIDIDRRLLALERNSGGVSDKPTSPGSPSGVTTVSPPAGPAPTVTGQAQDSATPVSKPVTTTQRPASKAGEQEAYQKAFDLLRELRYDKAVIAFRQFIQQYPNGRYAHIAQYWVGEANYAQRKFEDAITDYRKLISNYPKSPKIAEAMLKIGYSYFELKEYQKAEVTLAQLVKAYPGTTEASQAQNLIQQIRLKQNR